MYGASQIVPSAVTLRRKSMFKPVSYLGLIGIMLSPVAWGQLHLLAGSPHEKYNERFAAGLFRVEDDGTVKLLSELVPHSPGAFWINISYDLRKAVVETGYPEDEIIVVDFDTATSVKKCKLSPDPGGRRGYGEQWLSNPPAYGPSFEWVAASADPKDAVVRSMLLDPAVSCEWSFANRPPEAVRFAQKGGDAGPGDVVFNMGLEIVVGTGETLTPGRVFGFVGKHIPLGYDVPREVQSRGWYSSLAISDSRVFCLRLVSPHQVYRVLVFRKSDKTWHVLQTPSELVPQLRGFGRYIAVTEARAKSAKNLKSAGSEKWKKGNRKLGPELAGRIEGLQEPRVYPGKFHIYDVETEKVFPITTDQADSEILLVENGYVYYRVLNKLYAASISDEGIGMARLLATDDAILDAHWAFMKR